MTFKLANDVLAVSSPIQLGSSIFMIGVFGLAWIFCLLLVWAGDGKYRSAWIPLVVLGLFIPVLVTVLSNHATLVFDGPNGRLHMKEGMLFFSEVHDLPLEQVRGAVVVTSDQADALRVVLSDGTQWQISAYNQMGGKDRASFAINQFLKAHGQPGSL